MLNRCNHKTNKVGIRAHSRGSSQNYTTASNPLAHWPDDKQLQWSVELRGLVTLYSPLRPGPRRATG
jgi:hypothetical protein